MEEIEQLWQEHQAAGFPEGMAGEEIEGEELVSLDSFTAGCISAFIGNCGALDPDELECLTRCHEGLTKVLFKLAGEAAEYFSRLHRMSELALNILNR